MEEKGTSLLAIASLAFSCLGALATGGFAVLGVVFGFLAMYQEKKGKYAGRSLAQAGVIVGAGVLLIWLVKWGGDFTQVILAALSRLADLTQNAPWIPGGFVIGVLGLALLIRMFETIAKKKDARLLNRLLAQNRKR